MAKTAKRSVGDTGEGVACRYLETRGYRVLERNYLRPWGEIDIVAERPACAGRAKRLYFVEVKSVSRETTPNVTREPLDRFRPEENVHPAKLKRLHRAIQTYLLDHKVPESTEWQIDVICVYLDFSTHKARVEILENVIL
ncbi:MAG: YraN family protein [Patescibacteria group bacterium]